MFDGLDRGVTASEPAAIEHGADAAVYPRERDDEGKERHRVNPGRRPAPGERLERRKNQRKPCREGRKADDDRCAALGEQVEELERVLVIGPDEEEHQRQRFRGNLDETADGVVRAGAAREHDGHEERQEQQDRQPEEREHPALPPLGPRLARLAVAPDERDAVDGGGHEGGGQARTQELPREAVVAPARLEQQCHGPGRHDERDRVRDPERRAPGRGQPSPLLHGLRPADVHDDRREGERETDGCELELPGRVARDEAKQDQADVAAEPQEAEQEQRPVDAVNLAGRGARRVDARAPAPMAHVGCPENQDRAVRERAERVNQQRGQGERSHAPRIRSGPGRRKRNRMSGGCSA